MASTIHEIDSPKATRLVQQWVHPALRVAQVRSMHGGSMNHVFDFVLDEPSIPESISALLARQEGYAQEPRGIVAKLHDQAQPEVFERESQSLSFYRNHTHFPVPTPLAVVRDDPALSGCGLLMTKAPGTLLSQARITGQGLNHLNRQLAAYLIELHSHTRQTFGSALKPAGPEDWLSSFEPIIQQEFTNARDQLSSTVRPIIDRIVERLDRWVPRHPTPTLVHGDLWKNNVLVDDAHPDRPRITAFIDSQATYCDPVYELAYLRVFKTANDRFFHDYHARFPPPDDFERRCHIYWLNTMLAHVNFFGQAYLRPCERTANQLARLT